MNTMAFQITSLTIVYPTVYSGADERKYQSSASMAFVCVFGGGHRWLAKSPHKDKGPLTRNMLQFDDVTEATPLFTKRTWVLVADLASLRSVR